MGTRLYVNAEDKVMEKLAKVPVGTMTRLKSLEWVFKLFNVQPLDITKLCNELVGYKEFRDHEISSRGGDWHDEGEILWLFKRAHLSNEDTLHYLCFGKLNQWDYDFIGTCNLDENYGEVTESSSITNMLMNHDVDIHELGIDVKDIKDVYWS